MWTMQPAEGQAGARGPQTQMRGINPFQTSSPQAQAIADLFSVTLIVCGVIFLLVTGLVCYCVIHFRSRVADGEGQQFHGRQALEITWTVIPFLLLLFLFVLTVRAMTTSNPPDDQPPDVEVIGHQFWWEVRYPKASVVTANEIHIPTNRRLLCQVGTADVIHSFWIPQLGPKMDTIPEQHNRVWLQANGPGTYLGACSEFCGAQHAWMRLRVIAESPAQFEAWLRRQAQPALTPASAQARSGGQLFLQLTCMNCHRIAGTPAQVQVGPDLTHFGSRQTLGSGVLDNTFPNLVRWLKNPQAVKPGNLMPDMRLTDQQASALAGYLSNLN